MLIRCVKPRRARGDQIVCSRGAGLVGPSLSVFSSEDSIREAAASLIGSEVPASIEIAAALDIEMEELRDTSVPPSRLRGSPALPHESGVIHTEE